jgi:hypothetical protein
MLEPAASASLIRIRTFGLETLERLLDAGWEIEPPVIARQAWSQSAIAYHFILKRDLQRSLVVISDAPDLQRFLVQHQLTIH